MSIARQQPAGVRWITAAVAFVIGIPLSSCASPGTFRDVPHGLPHAVLVADEIDFPFTPFTPATETLVRSINEKTVEHADRRNRFRIPPGHTVIKPEIEDSPELFEPIHFNAVAGRKYVLFPPIKMGAMHLTEYLPGESRGKRIAWSGGGLRPPR